MPEEFREEFAPDDDLPADNPEQTELSSADLPSLEADLALGARVRESAAARAARLEADQRLVDILRDDGFETGCPVPAKAEPGAPNVEWPFAWGDCAGDSDHTTEIGRCSRSAWQIATGQPTYYRA